MIRLQREVKEKSSKLEQIQARYTDLEGVRKLQVVVQGINLRICILIKVHGYCGMPEGRVVQKFLPSNPAT